MVVDLAANLGHQFCPELLDSDEIAFRLTLDPPDQRRGRPRRLRIISKKPSGSALPVELELYF